MAQTGYTPILIYSSSTAAATPLVANLTNSTLGSELAINITDGKLFYKDNANAIQVIGWKTTPATAGGTGQTSYAVGDVLYASSTTALSKLTIGASNTIMTSSGTAPQWSAASGITVGTATNIAGGAAGSVPYQTGAGATSLLAIGTAYYMLGVNAGATAPSWQPSATSVLTTQGDLLYASAANTLARLAKNTTATRYLSNTGASNNPAWAQIDLTNGVTGTLPIGNGGTGQTSFTAGYVHFGSFSTDSNFFWDNTNKRLGLGTASPGQPLDLQTTSATTAANVTIARLWGKSSGNTTSAFGSLVSIGTQSPNGNGWFAYIGALNSPGGGSNYAELGLFSGITGNVPLETARCDYNGYLLVGYTSSNGAYRLQVNSQIFATSATIATSDGRYKENVQPLNGALDLVMAMNPVQFNWKKHPVHNFVTNTPTVGFIAQEMQQVLADKPYLNSIVKKNDCLITPEEYDEIGNVKKQAVYEEFFGIAEGNLVAVLAKAIQELKSEFDQYKATHP